MARLSVPNDNSLRQEKQNVSSEKNQKPIKEILNQDLGKGSIVFSPIFGNLKYLGDTKTKGLKFQSIKSKEIVYFLENGTYAEGGKVLLYPSEGNSNWEDVPIKYPQSKVEVINALCQIKRVSNEQIEALKNNRIYYYLQYIAQYLDNLSGNHINGYTLGKVWEVAPILKTEDNRNKLEWIVKRKIQPFYHFGFYSKKAAEVFLTLMTDDIVKWARQTYRVEKMQLEEALALRQENTAIIEFLSKKGK